MDNEEQIFESLVLELRRGTIVLSVLSQLDKPQYGYSLVMLLEEKGLKIDPGTLYPLLRRLEKQGILLSSWDTDTNKPRKYYELSEFGKKIYRRLCDYWLEIVKTMKNFINEGEI
ncbi:MAG: PadR family transcriptional regulator [Haloplasmataceae bacterium]|nr:PadR family transcriptional regulator [Haloplasmataceae bacterium]